jgi:hypothetical protein
MTRTFIGLASLPLLLAACGSAQSMNALPLTAASAAGTSALPDTGSHTAATNIPRLPLRVPGDYVVFRFSGKLKGHPLTLTERLVAIQDDATVIDYTLEDNASKQTMRVRMVGEGVEQKVASAAWMDGSIEGPVSTQAFDAFLARTIVLPDANGGSQGSEKATLNIDGRAMDCTKTTYKVTLGKKDATMTVLESEGFAWGDVGGEIHSADGSLLYKAELVGVGNVASTDSDSAVAQTSP